MEDARRLGVGRCSLFVLSVSARPGGPPPAAVAPPRGRVFPALIAALAPVALAVLTACGGGGGEEPPGETPTLAPTAERPTPTPTPVEPSPTAGAPQAASFSWCDLLTPEEADEALAEFVTGFPGGNLNCTWFTDSGTYVRFEPGVAADLEAGAEMEGVAAEPVAGVGEEAAWFDGVPAISHHWLEPFAGTPVTLGVLSLRQGDVYFRVMLNLPEVDGAAQLEIARDVAGKAIARLP